jgi:ubiquinone/menaquinone biosynthesis C-methylase UbiE
MKTDSDQRIAEKIFQFVELKGKRILEVGCGNGRISSILASKTDQLVAIDPDKRKIEEAKARGVGVEFYVGSGEDLDFPDNVFDVIIFTLSLHHQDSEQALKEAIRVFKEGGAILVIEPVVEGEIEKLFSLLINEDQTKLDAQKAIIESGLKIDQSQHFTAKWSFDNIEDLQKSPFDYYEMRFDIQVAEKILDQVCEKSSKNPIVLEDLMIIQLLSKPEKVAYA